MVPILTKPIKEDFEVDTSQSVWDFVIFAYFVIRIVVNFKCLISGVGVLVKKQSTPMRVVVC